MKVCKNAIRDIMLQRLKNEAEFCPDFTKYFYRCDLYSDGIFHLKTTRPQIMQHLRSCVLVMPQ